MTERPFPELLTADEKASLLAEAEQLWSDLQANDLGGFSNGNRPFYIVYALRRAIEKYGRRDTGLNWSKNDLDAAHQRKKGMNDPVQIEITEEMIDAATEELTLNVDMSPVLYRGLAEAILAAGISCYRPAQSQNSDSAEVRITLPDTL